MPPLRGALVETRPSLIGVSGHLIAAAIKP